MAYNSSKQLFLCHDSAGYYCLDALCTHEQCDMGTLSGGFSASNLGQGFSCVGCHGSKFDANGAVTHGPAFQPLPHYQVAVASNDHLWLDVSKTVGASCRCT